MEKKEESGGVLSVLFPGEDVEICEGHKIRVTPISLKNLPKVLTAFGALLKLSDDPDVKSQDIAISGASELLELLPFCIDRSTEEIPATVVPELLEAVLKQNVSEDSVGKWKALIRKVVERIPEDLIKRLPDQSRASKT